MGLVKRKLANIAYPTLDISKDENEYITIKTTAPFKTSTTRFKVGEEFDEERMDDKMVKSFVTREGNVFTQIQKDADNPKLDIKYIREFTADQIKVVSVEHSTSEMLVQCTHSFTYRWATKSRPYRPQLRTTFRAIECTNGSNNVDLETSHHISWLYIIT